MIMCIYILLCVYIYISLIIIIYLALSLSVSLSLSLSLSLYNGFLCFFWVVTCGFHKRLFRTIVVGSVAFFHPYHTPIPWPQTGLNHPSSPRPCLPGWALDGQQMEEIPSPVKQKGQVVEGKKRMRVPN